MKHELCGGETAGTLSVLVLLALASIPGTFILRVIQGGSLN